jgi:hypothetical protein
MAQQPNIELKDGGRPRRLLEPAPPRRQSPPRPGTILAPEEMPQGAGFGSPGPDTGWALKLVRAADIPNRTPALEMVLGALMGARASHYGRAPVVADLEVAMVLAGLGRLASEELDARRRRWVEAVAHEKSPGRTAVEEVGDDLHLDAEHAVVRARR